MCILVVHVTRYYEFELVTTGYMKVGFAKTTMEPGIELGMDGSSYAFDGHKVLAVTHFSRNAHVPDCVGCT